MPMKMSKHESKLMINNIGINLISGDRIMIGTKGELPYSEGVGD